jgi:hypothetical protein
MADKNTLVEKKAPDSVFNKYSIEQVMEALKSAAFENVEHYSEKDFILKQRNELCTTELWQNGGLTLSDITAINYRYENNDL